MLKTLFAALLAVVALTIVGSASADPMRYGVADDWPKFHPCGDIWWSSAKNILNQELRLTVQWDAGAPTVIPFPANPVVEMNSARPKNGRPILAIYPAKPSAI